MSEETTYHGSPVEDIERAMRMFREAPRARYPTLMLSPDEFRRVEAAYLADGFGGIDDGGPAAFFNWLSEKGKTDSFFAGLYARIWWP
jgi:hypothetical protein